MQVSTPPTTYMYNSQGRVSVYCRGNKNFTAAHYSFLNDYKKSQVG